MTHSPQWIPQPTQDGSFTFFSQEFGESFHSQQGARDEAVQKFAIATRLPQVAQQGQVTLLDVCYGLGYNTAAALEVIWAAQPDCHVELFALELDATVPLAAIAPPLLEGWSAEVQESLKAIAQHHRYNGDRLQATLLLSDARQTIQTLVNAHIQADAVFFDPFSPRRCPQLWTVEFFAQVARCLAPTGLLATYSRSASVRAAMQAAGLQIGTLPLSQPGEPHEWSQGTIGAFVADHLQPLSQLELEHLNTRAAIPYRDPTLSDPPDVILQRHQHEQNQCQRESTSNWRRRWGIV